MSERLSGMAAGGTGPAVLMRGQAMLKLCAMRIVPCMVVFARAAKALAQQRPMTQQDGKDCGASEVFAPVSMCKGSSRPRLCIEYRARLGGVGCFRQMSNRVLFISLRGDETDNGTSPGASSIK